MASTASANVAEKALEAIKESPINSAAFFIKSPEFVSIESITEST